MVDLWKRTSKLFDNSVPGTIASTIPQWLAVSLLLLVSSAPWLPQRFRLRTLLIATTLVAVVLGLVILLNK